MLSRESHRVAPRKSCLLSHSSWVQNIRNSVGVLGTQAGASPCGRFRLARAALWLLLDRGLRAVATKGSSGSPDWVAIAQELQRERNHDGAAGDAAERHAETGDEAAGWPIELQMHGCVVAKGGCHELARARALTWHDLLRCSAALERAGAAVQAVLL
jgi:hypothetical protein